MSSLTQDQIDAIELVQKNAYMQPIFFRKLKGLKWFDELYKRGFFNPENNPSPELSKDKKYTRTPMWSVLEYLNNITDELQEDNGQYSTKITDVIRNITNHSKDKGIENYRTWWVFSKIISSVSVDILKPEDQDLFDVWLSEQSDNILAGPVLGNKLLPKLLRADTKESKLLAFSLIKSLTKIKWKKNTLNELEPILPVDEHFTGEIFSRHSKEIGKYLEDEGVNIFKERLEEILEKSEKDEYSYIWRPAIEDDNEQNIRQNDYINILVSALRDSLLGFVDSKASKADKYISSLLESKKSLFERIAIYVMGNYLEVLKPLIDKILYKKYFDTMYKHEMYHFLKKNFQILKEQQSQIIEIIIESTKDDYDVEATPKIQEIQRAYSLLRWLTAIKGKGNDEVDLLYSENISITGKEPEYSDFPFYMRSGLVVEETPFTTKELLSRGFDGLLNILNNFKEEEGWEKPTRRGLAQSLKEALKLKPEIFRGNLEKLTNIHFDYICHIIDGYKDLWNEGENINWQELLAYCLSLIETNEFWAESDKNNKPMTANKDWVVDSIADIIKSGTANEDKSFDSALMPLAGKIIQLLLNKQEGNSFEGQNDAVFISINSSRGKVIEALINYSLRKCRLADRELKNHEDVWDNELQSLFDNELNLAAYGNYEFVTLFANYLPNFLYMNKDWTIQSLPKIFDKQNRKKWLCAIEGYTYVNTIYDEIYKFLRDSSNLKEALTAEEIESTNKDKLIQNIALSYQIGNENLDQEGMLTWLLNRWNYNEIHELIWFYWSTRSDDADKINKIMQLWTEIDKRIDETKDSDKRTLSSLCMWSVFIKELNENNKNLLMRLASYAEVEYHSYILIEELKRLVDDYPEEVGDIFYKILEKFAPTYEEQNIRYILEKLYEGSRDKANKILDKYVMDYQNDTYADIRK